MECSDDQSVMNISSLTLDSLMESGYCLGQFNQFLILSIDRISDGRREGRKGREKRTKRLVPSSNLNLVYVCKIYHRNVRAHLSLRVSSVESDQAHRLSS